MKKLIIFMAILMMSITAFPSYELSTPTNDIIWFKPYTTNFNLCSFLVTNNIGEWSSYIDPKIVDYYNAKVEKVVDGDTADLMIDLGFNIVTKKRVRLFGINAPEMKNDTNNVGHEAKSYLTSLIDGKNVIMRLEKQETDKYGRYIVTIYCNQVNINEKMVTAGKAERHNYE